MRPDDKAPSRARSPRLRSRGAVPWLDLEDGYGAYLVLEADSELGHRLAEQLWDLIEVAVTGSRR